jgi:hypothetical protein
VPVLIGRHRGTCLDRQAPGVPVLIGRHTGGTCLNRQEPGVPVAKLPFK